MRFKSIIAATFVALSLSAPAVFAGGGMTGGATEFTQVMNNGLLTKSVAHEATMVANQVREITVSMNQYATMIQNLRQLPAQVVGQMLGPFAQDIRTYTDAYRAVTGLYNSASDAQRVFENRAREMKNIKAAGFNPDNYLAYESSLATRNAAVKQKLEGDMATLQDYQAHLQSYQQQAASKAGAINGNVSGFQTLSTMASQQLGELAEMNKQMREQIAAKHVDDAIRLNDEAAVQKAEMQSDADKAQFMKDFDALKNKVRVTNDYDLQYRTFK